MALHWNWNDKCGEAVIQQGERIITLNLYEGNAFLIFLYESKKENGEDVWQMFDFWADRQDMRNYLGLNKKDGYSENKFDEPGRKLIKIRINKAKYRQTKNLVSALTMAFSDLTIELYSDSETA